MDFKKTATEILEPDKKLAVVVGNEPRTRSEVIRKLWDYINERGLQDTDRRMINADKDLQEVLGGRKQVNVFQITALVGKHLRKPSRKATPSKNTKKTSTKTPKKAAKKTAKKKASSEKATKKSTKKVTKKTPKRAPKKVVKKTPKKGANKAPKKTKKK